MKRYWIPLTFWDDHCERFPIQSANEVRRTGFRALIEGTQKQIDLLRSDAEHYCDRDGPDDCPASIKASAKRVLEALRPEKQLPESTPCP